MLGYLQARTWIPILLLSQVKALVDLHHPFPFPTSQNKLTHHWTIICIIDARYSIKCRMHVFTIVQTNTSDTLNIKSPASQICLVVQSPASFGRVTCLPPKMWMLREAVMASGDWQLLCDKLALSNTYPHAKNRNDLHPISLSKVPFSKVGFSAVAILGGGWLQSPASDGPPC